MTNERQWHVYSKLDYFYRPSEENSNESKGQVDERNGLDKQVEEEQKNSSMTKLPLVAPVIKMLDSLKLSPRAARHILSNSRVVIPAASGSKVEEKKEGFVMELPGAFVSYKPSFVNGAIDGKPAENGLETCGHEKVFHSHEKLLEDSIDSHSDSTFSQSSDLSQNSDVRSLNTTSTDSDNYHIYQQIVQADRNRSRFNTITVQTANGFTIDLDVEVTKTVVMLMKIILWLRQRYPNGRTIYYRQPKYKALSAPMNFPESSSDESSSSQDTVKPSKTKKRISFSPNTLLFSAITEKSFSEAKVILENNNIDVNQQTPSGQSLLHIAAGNADLKCVRLLLEYGADANIQDGAGWGPLNSAIRQGNWKCAIMLIEAGANFAEYSQRRILEYKEVLKKSRTCYRSMEIFV